MWASKKTLLWPVVVAKEEPVDRWFLGASGIRTACGPVACERTLLRRGERGRAAREISVRKQFSPSRGERETRTASTPRAPFPPFYPLLFLAPSPLLLIGPHAPPLRVIVPL